MRCMTCGCYAPTKYVEFYQNIGALVMRFSKEVKGELCKRCINKFFAEMTLITLAVGWLGFISMIIAPFFILNNVIRWLGTLGLKEGNRVEKVRDDHPTLNLTADAEMQLMPYTDQILELLHAGQPVQTIADAIAPHAKVSAVQAELFIQKLKS